MTLKIFNAALFLFLCGSLQANADCTALKFNCEISRKDRDKQSILFSGQLFIQLSRCNSRVESLVYRAYRLLDSSVEGERSGKDVEIYSRFNRGGIPVSSCRLYDDNTVISESGNFYLGSECRTHNDGRVYFDANLSTKRDGEVNTTWLPLGGAPQTLTIEVEKCVQDN
jgi:hypothetical protein